MSNRIMVFGAPGSEHIADDLAIELGLPDSRVPIEYGTYTGGEMHVRIGLDDRYALNGKDAILVGSIHDAANAMEVYSAAFTLLTKGVNRLILVIPYLAFSTQEREAEPNEAVMAKVMAHMFSGLPQAGRGTRLLLLDLHTSGIRHYFDACLAPEEVYGQDILMPAIRKLQLPEYKAGSADFGRLKWVRSYADALGVPMVAVEKLRTGEDTKVLYYVGDPEGGAVVMYDDLTRSGQSAENALNAYEERGATEGHLALSHLPANNESVLIRLRDSKFQTVITTDSHRMSQHPIVKASDKFVVCRTAPLFARPIRAILGWSE